MTIIQLLMFFAPHFNLLGTSQSFRSRISGSLVNMKHDSRVFSVEKKLGNAVIGYDTAHLHDGTSMLMRSASGH